MNPQLIQLICEINSNIGFNSDQWMCLCESMDISMDDLCALLDEAHIEWENIKSKLLEQ